MHQYVLYDANLNHFYSQKSLLGSLRGELLFTICVRIPCEITSVTEFKEIMFNHLLSSVFYRCIKTISGRTLFATLGGKCGICGDSYKDPNPRDHESPGGKYAKGMLLSNIPFFKNKNNFFPQKNKDN